MKKRKYSKRECSKSYKNNGQNETMLIYHEMISGKGEDFYLMSAAENYGVIGVFDGCGGSGSRIYAEYKNQTGAYISSRVTAAAVLEWFNKFCEEDKILSKNTIEDICIELENRIYSVLEKLKSNTKPFLLKGSMLKNFPTTASLICHTRRYGKLYAAFIWCGDSRGYVLKPQGLVQVTRDDISTELDAMSNLKSDGQLTNVISADGNFILHGAIIECDEPAILITATDGSFGYFSTPMEFEYLLLHTLVNSSNIKEWNKNINSYLKPFAGDDYTMVISLCGFKSFNTVKRTFLKRERHLYNKYLSKSENISIHEKDRLWKEYALVYYGDVNMKLHNRAVSKKLKYSPI